MKENTTPSLQTGDTLFTAKRTLEAVLVLSKETQKRLLLPTLYKDSSLHVSVAHFIETLVLHESLFCSFSSENFHRLLFNTGLQTLSEIIHPIPMESLFVELKKHGNPNNENIQLGYERINNEPSMILSNESSLLFTHNFPSWKDNPSIPKGKLATALSKHFQYYESVSAFATGIIYAITGQESQQLANITPTGYKVFGEQTLAKTMQAAQSRIQELNSWFMQERFSLETPLVFNYIVEKASNKKDILSIALELRNSKEAIAFRKQCALFDQALKEGNDKALIEMINEVDDKIKQLSRKIPAPKLNIDIAFPFSVSVSPPELLEYISSVRNRHLIFISQLYDSALRSRNVYERFHKLL